MSRLIRCILSVFVLVCLTAGSAQALPARPVQVAVSEVASVLDAAWSWLRGRLRPAEPAAPRQDGSRQQKHGCGMDPDGVPSSCG
jgi:hypothetical protein